MQLDTDEGEMFAPPAGIVVSSNDQTSNNTSAAHQESEGVGEGNEGISGVQA